MDETRKEGKKEFEPRFTSELFAWGESLMGVLIAFVIIFTFVVRLFGVDGMSMYPTLEDRSIMLVSNLGYHPEKGDIVVLRKDGFYSDQPIVKRVIATGGDTVDIDPVTGDVSVNGEVLDEPYIAEKIDTLTRMGDLSYPQTIPEGCVFVMGDALRDEKLAEDIGSGYSVIVANIVADVIIGMAPMFFAKTAEGGTLICSGILNERADEVRAALEKAGFEVVNHAKSDDWSAFTAKK